MNLFLKRAWMIAIVTVLGMLDDLKMVLSNVFQHLILLLVSLVMLTPIAWVVSFVDNFFLALRFRKRIGPNTTWFRKKL